ncbi:MAG TPA: amidase family protein [Acidimicrobiales bacterium]|nr:amidase family protein [Acidimicrobiales bacterium]
MTTPDGSPALWNLNQQAEAIRGRKISSREMLDEYLARVERINPQLNAVVTLDPGPAGEAAARADQEASRRTADLGPLHGLPVTIKDAIETAGIRSTGGARELSTHVPERDAPAVAKLKAAGAIVFGKTNAPRWSGDMQTFNDLFGTTNNPWDHSRTPGGSSGGAAASVAAGLTSFELGTDIGGSVRVPSNFCGVFGHKPSFGVIPQQGYLDHVGGGRIDADINVFGPIARSAGDLASLLEVLGGPSGEDEKAWRLDLPPARHNDVRDYRIGTWLDDPAGEVDSEVGETLDAAAEALAKAGAKVSGSRPPIRLPDAVALFNSLITPAISVSTDKQTGDAISGTHREWLDNHQSRGEMRSVWSEWFREFDILLCPVTPMAAFPHDQSGSIVDRSVIINGHPRPHIATLAWTGLVGVVYLPSTVVPVGFTPGGLPVGIQVVGPYLEDRTPLFVAAELEALLGGYTPPPGV